jgi:UDP-N-acetylmuramoyl-L-alanyl-D-glutamate--2,6-diaminopimelate ligase
MTLDQALADIHLLERDTDGAGPSSEVSWVQYDSRRVQPGDIFVAMAGGTTDGNRFIASAIERGAAAIATDSPEAFAARPASVPFVLVASGRRALAGIAANLLDHPERKLKISAVTGTNGKTTTAFLLEQMLRCVGRKCVLIGTIETHIVEEVRPSEHTTPEASDLFKLFADGVAAGATEVVMEMSSHALDQERVWGVPVDVAIFTNLTQDHLDYHGTMERYGAAKARLFAGVGAPPPRVSVVNADDPFGSEMLASLRARLQPSAPSALIFKGTASAVPSNSPKFDGALAPDGLLSDSLEHDQTFLQSEVLPYGIEAGSYRAESTHYNAGLTDFTFRTPSQTTEIFSPLTGRVNVYNLLAAFCAALSRGLTMDEIVTAAAQLHQVPGRFQVVPGSLAVGFTVVVDYAHTDDALKNLITLARELVAPTGKRVITVFGCGGDRDRTKRPKMGRVAGEGSDLVVLTSDNPRSEDPAAILAEVLEGLKGTPARYIVEPDRAKAIELAIREAKEGDIVLIAGKGHEKVQILRDGTIPFDDVDVAQAILTNLPPQAES